MTYPSDDETPWVPPRERKVPRMDHTAGWKESAYHPRIGEIICARIEAGETVRQVAADPNMPAYCTIYQWRKVHPEFDAMYRAMRERLARGRIEAADLARRSKVYWRIHKARVDGKRPRDWVAGRRSSYRRDWAEAYCERLIAGQSGMRICADPAMPSAKQVYRWLKTIPEFRHMYVEARAIQKIGLVNTAAQPQVVEMIQPTNCPIAADVHSAVSEISTSPIEAASPSTLPLMTE